MKKLSSALALSLVLAMLLGMTAFAAGSPKDPEEEGITASLDNPESLKPEGSQLVIEAADFEKDIKEEDRATLANLLDSFTKSYENGSSSVSYKATVTRLKTLKISNGEGELLSEGLVLRNAFEFEDGVTYFAYHLHTDGTWERHMISAYGAGTMMLWGVKDFSDFVFYKMELTPVTTVGENPSPTTTTQSTAPTTPVSPKTGEAMPVAALIALLTLAGAAAVVTRRVIAER